MTALIRRCAGLVMLSCAVLVCGEGPAAAGRDDASLSLSVRVSVLLPSSVTLRYVLVNTGERTISDLELHDPLVPDGSISCAGADDDDDDDGDLPPGAKVVCTAHLNLSPGSYTSRPEAIGCDDDFLLLILRHRKCDVAANAEADFTIAAPVTPPPPSGSPTPTPVPVPVRVPPPPRVRVRPRPVVRQSVPPVVLPLPVAPPSPTPRPTPVPAPKPPPRIGAVYRIGSAAPPAPPLPFHSAVLLLMIPGAAAAVAAGAVGLRRR